MLQALDSTEGQFLFMAYKRVKNQQLHPGNLFDSTSSLKNKYSPYIY